MNLNRVWRMCTAGLSLGICTSFCSRLALAGSSLGVRPNRFLRICVLSMFSAAALPAWAQVTIPDEYDKHIQQRSAIGALGGDLAGDHVSLSNGRLEITQTDVDLPGNDALSVRVGRRFRPNGTSRLLGHFFYGWDLDIPNAHGVFGNNGSGSGWINTWSGTTNRVKRCSLFSYPPAIVHQGGSWDTDEFWQGSFFYLPGSGDQELLAKPSSNAHVPTDGNTYPIVTREGAAVRCVSLAATSESGSQGEGYEVVTPDGVIYTLNQMVSRLESTLNKNSPAPMLLATDTQAKTKTSSESLVATPNVAVNYVLPRKEFLLYPTKVTDRFGNTVTYVWSTTNPWQLLQMIASDGRHLDFTYQSSTSVQVSSVTDGTRTWRYGYDGSGSDELVSVTLPDGSAWGYNLHDLLYALIHPDGVDCDNMSVSTAPYVGSVTSPSGATVEYTMGLILSGRSWVFRECIYDINGGSYAREPYRFAALALTGKKITGPGLPTAGLTWSYSYGAANHCWDPASVPVGNYAGLVPCTASSPTTRVVSVTDPQGTVTRYTFGNRYRVNEGLLLTTEYGWNGSSALRTEAITYADPEAAPYVTYNGASVRHMGDYDITGFYRPQQQVTTTQQGRTFTWQVATGCASGYCFDTFARPTSVVKSSSP